VHKYFFCPILYCILYKKEREDAKIFGTLAEFCQKTAKTLTFLKKVLVNFFFFSYNIGRNRVSEYHKTFFLFPCKATVTYFFMFLVESAQTCAPIFVSLSIEIIAFLVYNSPRPFYSMEYPFIFCIYFTIFRHFQPVTRRQT
jgi:hypothetical protein